MKPQKPHLHLIFIFLVCKLMNVSAATHVTTTLPSFEEKLKKTACFPQIAQQISNWKTLHEWNERPKLDPLQAGISFISPTEKLGSWVEVKFLSDNRAIVTYFNANSSEQFSWNEHCQTKTTSKIIEAQNQIPPGKKAHSLFSDEDLQQVVQKNERGVLFVWSPHMPCSVKGLKSMQKTAESMKIPLVALLDPSSNFNFAKRLAHKEGFSEQTLTPVQSLELILRGFTNYLPAVQVFAGGKLKGPVFRGFQDNTNYQRFIESNW